jgi:hypothetical protein
VAYSYDGFHVKPLVLIFHVAPSHIIRTQCVYHWLPCVYLSPKRGRRDKCKKDTETQKQSAMESTQIPGKPECTDLLSNNTSFLCWSVHQTHEHTNVQSLYKSHPAQNRTTKTKPQSVPLVPELLVVSTSE